MNYPEAESKVYPLTFKRRVISGGMGMPNHVGAGDRLREVPIAIGIDLARVLVTFCQCKSNTN